MRWGGVCVVVPVLAVLVVVVLVVVAELVVVLVAELVVVPVAELVVVLVWLLANHLSTDRQMVKQLKTPTPTPTNTRTPCAPKKSHGSRAVSSSSSPASRMLKMSAPPVPASDTGISVTLDGGFAVMPFPPPNLSGGDIFAQLVNACESVRNRRQPVACDDASCSDESE